ncbi:MAG: hypothetical protein RR290_00465 [Clostridia bacterium]
MSEINYLDDEENVEEEIEETPVNLINLGKYECLKCGFIIDLTHIPSTFKLEFLEKCPKCGADKKHLKKMDPKQKISSKELLKQKMKKIAEEEEKKEQYREDVKEVCEYIIDETFCDLDDLEDDLKKGKITTKRFGDIFFDRAFKNVMIKKNTYYPSNYFIANFREAILDFNKDISDVFGDLDKMETKEIRSKDFKYEIKEREKKDMKNPKKRIDNEFSDILRKDVKDI